MDPINIIPPRSSDYVDWSEAYERVENYFCSLQIQNKLLLSQLVATTLQRSAKRLETETNASPPVIALQEAHRQVHDWFAEVLRASGVETQETGPRGRLALFLTDMPQRWQNEFLHPGPWPDDFLHAMRSTYLRAGPDFQKASMVPRQLDFGPVSTIADETWKAIDRWPALGTGLIWTVYAGALSIFFYLTW